MCRNIIRLLIMVAMVTAIVRSVDCIFRKVRKEMVIGPNTQIRIEYKKASTHRRSSSWLLISAPLGQRIDVECSIDFYSPTSDDYCTENIFYYNDKSSKVIAGAHYLCNTPQVKLTSQIPLVKENLTPPFLVLATQHSANDGTGTYDCTITTTSEQRMQPEYVLPDTQIGRPQIGSSQTLDNNGVNLNSKNTENHNSNAKTTENSEQPKMSSKAGGETKSETNQESQKPFLSRAASQREVQTPIPHQTEGGEESHKSSFPSSQKSNRRASKRAPNKQWTASAPITKSSGSNQAKEGTSDGISEGDAAEKTPEPDGRKRAMEYRLNDAYSKPISETSPHRAYNEHVNKDDENNNNHHQFY